MKEFGLRIGLSKIDAFEGWFCKIDDWKNELMLSVIWGYSTHKKTKHAFIQFQDTLSHGTSYISYPLDELKWKADPFVLQIGNNVLSESGVLMTRIQSKNSILLLFFESLIALPNHLF